MLDTTQAAHRLGCSTAHVHTLIRTGKLEAVNIGAGKRLPRWRIPEEALVAFMQAPEGALVGRMKTR